MSKQFHKIVAVTGVMILQLLEYLNIGANDLAFGLCSWGFDNGVHCKDVSNAVSLTDVKTCHKLNKTR